MQVGHLASQVLHAGFTSVAHHGTVKTFLWLRGLLARFLPLLGPYRGRLILALGASTLRPPLSAARLWLVKILIDTVLHGQQLTLLPVVAAGFVLIAAVRGLLVFWDEGLSGWVGAHLVRDLRGQLYTHLQGLSLRYYHGQRLGDLLTRLSGDVGAIEDLLVSGLADLVAHSLTVLLYLGLLLYLDARLALVALLVLPFLALSTREESRRGRLAQQRIRESASHLTSTAEEGLSAIALVKAFARAPHEQARFAEAAQRSAAARFGAVRVRAIFIPIASLTAALGTAAVVWAGANAVVAGQLSLGSLVVFLSYLGALYGPLQGLSRLGSTIQRARVGVERILEILETPAALQERLGAPPLPPVRGLVEFRHVAFGYSPDRPVLHDVGLRVCPGELVALIGASGAGKTTVVSLLLAYYDPDAGEICLGGYPLGGYDPASVRRQVAAVLQEPMLFNTSVRENLRYGRLDATDAEIEAAARFAEADSFIRALPQGYDTVVGPRGGRLSGGQRQRLAIARALVKPAPVLVLDEATSALDPATEARILGRLRRDLSDQAVLLVAHRLSTVRHADRIVVLGNGRVVEDGTPENLLRRDGAYAQFVRDQDSGSPTEPATCLRRAGSATPGQS